MSTIYKGESAGSLITVSVDERTAKVWSAERPRLVANVLREIADDLDAQETPGASKERPAGGRSDSTP